ARQRTLRPLSGIVATMPVSRQTPSRLGPRHCGQSSAESPAGKTSPAMKALIQRARKLRRITENIAASRVELLFHHPRGRLCKCEALRDAPGRRNERASILSQSLLIKNGQALHAGVEWHAFA